MVCNDWDEKCEKMTQEQIDNCFSNGEGVGCLAAPLTTQKEPVADVPLECGVLFRGNKGAKK